MRRLRSRQRRRRRRRRRGWQRLWDVGGGCKVRHKERGRRGCHGEEGRKRGVEGQQEW